MRKSRRWLWLTLFALLLVPGVARAQMVNLAGPWDTAAVVTAGPDTGQTFWGWWDLTAGSEAIAGTFHATVSGVSLSGSLSGTQVDGRLQAVGEVADSDMYQLTVDAVVADDGQIFSGSWTDSAGRSGHYRGVRQAETLPQAGEEAPWELLIAAWALLGAALLSRGARKRLAS